MGQTVFSPFVNFVAFCKDPLETIFRKNVAGL